jgi:hypothetical protein
MLADAAAPGTSCLWLSDVRIQLPGQAPRVLVGRYPVPLVDRLLTARAGSSCHDVSPLGTAHRPEPRQRPRVPKGRVRSASELTLDGWYAATERLRRRPASEQPGLVAAIESALEAELPHEWLLRWNLLECLTDLNLSDSTLGRQLKTRLLELEHYHEGKHPIALGLHYLELRALARGARPLP